MAHIKNILEDNELDGNSVIKDFLITAADGKNYQVKHYALDMILAIGFRIRSNIVNFCLLMKTGSIVGLRKEKPLARTRGKLRFFFKGILIMNEFIKIDKQKMAERLKEDICRLVGKQEFDVAYARWLDLQIVLKDLGAGDE